MFKTVNLRKISRDTDIDIFGKTLNVLEKYLTLHSIYLS